MLPEDADVSDFEILSARLVNPEAAFAGTNGQYCREAASLRDGKIARRLAQPGSPPPRWAGHGNQERATADPTAGEAAQDTGTLSSGIGFA